MSPSKNTQKKLRNLGINFLVLFVVLLLCLAAGEAGVRVFKSDEVAPGLWPKENAQFVPELKKNVYVNLTNFTKSTSEFSYTINTNHLGFRDFHSLQKEEGVYRIAIIGSSSVFGNTVDLEQTYPSILESSMGGVEVINLGLGGSGLGEMNYILQEYAPKYNPDLIVVEVGLGNLYATNLFDKRSSTQQRKSFTLWVYENSKFINHLYWKAKTTPLGHTLITTLGINRHGRNSNAFDLALLQGRNTPAIQDSIHSTYQNLAEMKKSAQAQDIPLLVLFLPPPYQINPERLDVISESYNLDEANLNPRIAQEIYTIITQRLGLDFFDPTQDLIEHPRATQMHWNFDGHFNADGNQVYAALLGELIKEEYLIE